MINICLLLGFTLIDIILFVFALKNDLKLKREIKEWKFHYDLYNNDTKEDVKSLGFSVSLIGLMGKGKTTLASCLKEVFVEECLEKIKKEMNDIRDMFYYYEFKKIDSYLMKRFFGVKDGSCKTLNSKGYPFNYINYEFKDVVLDEVISMFNIRNGLVSNYLNVKEIRDLFRIYVDDFYILNIRKNYVLSDVAMYSYLTNNFSKFLSKDTLEIKNVARSKNFYVERYSILIQDEKSLGDGNEKSISLNYKRLGTKQFKLLLRNASEGTCRYITCKQSNDDEVITDRRLYTNSLYIVNSKVTNPLSKWVVKLRIKRAHLLDEFRKYYQKKSFFSSKFKVIYPTFDAWLNSNDCSYKHDMYIIKCFIDFLNSQGFIEYEINDYYNYSDVGKKDETLYQVRKWVFPLSVAWGTVDSYEYKGLFPLLSKRSDYCYDSVLPNSFYTNRLKEKEKFKFLDEDLPKEKKDVVTRSAKADKKEKEVKKGSDIDEYIYK